jgi:hypothetical protein
MVEREGTPGGEGPLSRALVAIEARGSGTSTIRVTQTDEQATREK